MPSSRHALGRLPMRPYPHLLQVFIDVLESVNLLMGADGALLRNDVTGSVQVKTVLSGMPECKFGLNDKLTMDRDGGSSKSKRVGVEIDDCTFHRCVRLGKFDADRTITFIPPDGEFELMKYRITNNINLPFKIMPVIREPVAERGPQRVEYNGTNDNTATAGAIHPPPPPFPDRMTPS